MARSTSHPICRVQLLSLPPSRLTSQCNTADNSPSSSLRPSRHADKNVVNQRNKAPLVGFQDLLSTVPTK